MRLILTLYFNIDSFLRKRSHEYQDEGFSEQVWPRARIDPLAINQINPTQTFCSSKAER